MIRYKYRNFREAFMDYTMYYDLVKDQVPGLSEKFHLYYDETNNIRSFSIDEHGFNADEHAYFILGGIGIENNTNKIIDRVDRLFSDFRLQNSVQEIKFKHIRNGATSFLELLSKKKIKTLVNWLYENKDVYVHYNYMDNFYFSIVDIIDSLDNVFLGGLHLNRILKDILYKIVRSDTEYFTKLLFSINYPNVTNPDILILSIINRIEIFDPHREIFELEYLRQILKSSLKKDLPLLQNNIAGELIDNYSDMYEQCIYSFPHSKHIFDHELSIESILQESPISVNDEVVHYIFVDSKEEKLIQISDLIVNILKYWMSFLEENSEYEIIKILDGLSNEQAVIVKNLQDVMNRSLDISPGFKIGVGSNTFELKIKLFLEFKFIK